MLHLRRAVAATLVFAALMLGLATAFSPTASVSPFQAAPQNAMINYLTSVAIFFAGALAWPARPS